MLLGLNLALLMRQLIEVGTPRGLQGRVAAAVVAPFVVIRALWEPVKRFCSPLPFLHCSNRLLIVRYSETRTATSDPVFATGC